MSAIAEAQARLTASLRDIVTFFNDEVNLPESSMNILKEYIDRHLSVEFLSLSESYGHSMAFLDHNELINRLFTSWSLLLDGYVLERKLTMKRIRMLKEDKKADPNTLAKQETILHDIEEKKTKVLLNTMRLRAMKIFPIEAFKAGSADCKREYRRMVNEEVQRKKGIKLATASKDSLGISGPILLNKEKKGKTPK